MRLWIDLDGVISSFTSNAVRVINELWPEKNLPADFVPADWDYTGILEKKDWSIFWDHARSVPDFWLRQPPIEENVSALRTWLKETEHQVFYITSRIDTGGMSAHLQTAQWLIRNNIYPPEVSLIVAGKPPDKEKYIREHSIDYGIDDLPATVSAVNMISWHHCFLLDRPYNREISNQARVYHLQEFLDIVDSAALAELKT